MLKMSLSLLMFFFSISMFFIYHPLSLGLIILIQTLIMCLLSGMMIKTYWFSYILFLTFLGGLLVLFIYVSSIASNELFKFSFKWYFFILSFIFLIFIFNYIFFNKLNWMNLNFNSEMNKLFNLNNLLFLNNENKLNLNKLYNNQTFLIMLMMMIYLLITLIIVIKIINIIHGPLRSSF